MAGVTKQQLPTNLCICKERPSDLLEGSSQSPTLAPTAATVPHGNYYFSSKVSELRLVIPWPTDKNNHNLSSRLP